MKIRTYYRHITQQVVPKSQFLFPRISIRFGILWQISNKYFIYTNSGLVNIANLQHVQHANTYMHGVAVNEHFKDIFFEF